MDWAVANPASFRVNNPEADWESNSMSTLAVFAKAHDSHPALGHLVLLVFEAVLEVVCVALPGYIIARLGAMDADKQKFLANLNIMIFTPCLIFTKLASQLNADKLLDLAIIPIIFIIQTAVSYLVSAGVSRAFRLKQRPANFVTAMGVFGNSNSLPISLVLSLSQTLKGLHWDRIEGDNDDEVGARGILYLMIFQQLGQLVRWSWGYHVLLAPKNKYDDYRNETVEEGRYVDDPRTNEEGVLIPGLNGGPEADDHYHSSDDSEVFEPAGRTPVAGASRASPNDSEEEDNATPRKRNGGKSLSPNGTKALNDANDHLRLPTDPDGEILSFPRMYESEEQSVPDGMKGYFVRAKLSVKKSASQLKQGAVDTAQRAYVALPGPMQIILQTVWKGLTKFYHFVWEFMNPPLWAMLIAIVVASIPDLQRLFFEEGSFIKNSVTSAIKSSAGVAVPLILVVLGGNLARNTQNRESTDAEEQEIGTRLLVASLISRMLLPTIIMAPILALLAKYVPVSILDDPIFIIVCFLLTGAPSALQLAQICQLNEVYESVMSKILFQSYVIWILPSTLILVMLALETVEWAAKPI